LLGAFVLGVLQDLLSAQGLGLHAFSYGLVAMFTISTQEFVYRENPLTHLTLGLVGGMVLAVVLVLHAWLKTPAPIKAPFISAILTAAVAPILLGVLQRMKRAFAFEEQRRRF
jgi:rod shape-determining protein MreD